MAFEYKFGGRTITLPVDSSLVAVRFREPAPREVRAMHMAALGAGPLQPRIELPGEKFTLISAGPGGMGFAAAAPGAMAGGPAAGPVARTAPVFKVNGQTVLATDRLIIGFNKDITDADARRFLRRRNYEVIDEMEGAFVVRLGESVDPFAEIARLDQVKSVRYAEPDFVTIGRHIPQGPAPAEPLSTPAISAADAEPSDEPGPAAPATDPYLARQYAMKITRADRAWKLLGNAANEQIKIAILDEGVDRAHEDLRIMGEYDATGNDLDQQPNPWDGHGTACAGLAAAKGKNNVGIRGVAPGFPVIAVRIAYSAYPNGNWVTSNSIIARAITWAWQSGADVLSNSWGGGAPSSLIVNAFESARTKGRGGKGCVVVVAAGNSNSPIAFPADLPDVLTVTASNEYDQPKTPTSSDGETWWGSCYGPPADVAAPGVHNYTTDNSGGAGYSVGGVDPAGRLFSANYTHNFNGTSSSTPLVAGAAALCLAVKKDLREKQVREIIKATADKVGGAYDASGFNPRMGMGRLNVMKAVKLAKATTPNQGGATGASLQDADVKPIKSSSKAGV